ncbi:MAG: peroxiredoxin [Thermocladium sp.]
MVREGDYAPDFEASAHDGSRIRLSELRGKWVVVYFFPKAFTPGCTRETQAFASSWNRFKELSIEVLGISRDDVATLARFAKAEGANFRLISDVNGSIAKSFNVLGMLGMADRVTFIVDPEGRIASIIRGFSVRPDQHPNAALRAISEKMHA